MENDSVNYFGVARMILCSDVTSRQDSFSLSSVIVIESQREKRVKHNDMMIISKYERE